MQQISVFDMLKIGVGPSSSHTMGPWRAAQRFLDEMVAAEKFDLIARVSVELYGSLAKTGRGHGTDIAVLMGLRGEDPVTCEPALIQPIVQAIHENGEIDLLQQNLIPFDPDRDLIFRVDQTLPGHPNGIRFVARLITGQRVQAIYYSVGGGFVVGEHDTVLESSFSLPYPCQQASDILDHCHAHNLALWEMVLANEKVWRTDAEIHSGLQAIWQTMTGCIYRGCHTEGVLPGGLNVVRRASKLHDKLIGSAPYTNQRDWLNHIKARFDTPQDMVKWISCFALAVNEENASFGRVVTAPTNGAAGVLPAVLMYTVCCHNASEDDIERFLLVAGEIGSLFKKGATISAAMGGCQAEIGVSSAMAAAALTEILGGSVDQALMAAEIAMEHHLGLTCDPVAGLVQVPCIERNTMGAIKAITAAHLALESLPEYAKVSLDSVIKTMWETALDMNDKYKETSEGGLAATVPVNVIAC